MSEEARKPELFIGLVGPIGTDLEAVCTSLERVLSALRYETQRPIRLSSLLREIPKWQDLPEKSSYKYYMKHMDAGNELRRDAETSDALSRLALASVLDQRQEKSGSRDKPSAATAYIFRSLKTPDEVKFLRSIYGEQFICVGVHAPRASRVDRLAEDIARTELGRRTDECRAEAENLVSRDQNEESDPFGQNVRKAFPLADVFVDASETDKHLERVFNLYFGDAFITPKLDEVGLYYAHASALRSASPGRQVGAAILDKIGAVLSVGTNEIPKSKGGLCSADDPDHLDYRQFRKNQVDKSDELKNSVLMELVALIKSLGWLKEEIAVKEPNDLVDILSHGDPENPDPAYGERRNPETIRVNQLIEFVPEVHAEMAAIIDAARRGLSVQDATLYTTTFPCHDCAKHIIAAGISRVIYLDPYPKSLVKELYQDQVDVDGDMEIGRKVTFQRYIGLAPRRYIELFTSRERKSEDGTIKKWKTDDASFKLHLNPSNYILQEIDSVKKIQQILNNIEQIKSKGENHAEK